MNKSVRYILKSIAKRKVNHSLNLYFILKIQCCLTIMELFLIVVHVEETPWFPRRITDLDQSSIKVLLYGAALDADHPVRKKVVMYSSNMRTFLI